MITKKIRAERFPNCDNAVLGGCVIRKERECTTNVCELCNAARDE